MEQIDMRMLADRLGVPVTGADDPAIRADIDAMLTACASDASADQAIDDGHPRFYQHSSIVAMWGDMDPANQHRIDGIRWSDNAGANQAERDAIAAIRARYL
jgi:hypothetical protein